MQDEFTAEVAALRRGADGLLASPVLTSPDDRSSLIARAVDLRGITERVIAATVRHARHDGASWKEIGDALGVTRQAAFQRYGKPVDPRTGELMNTTPLPEANSLAERVIADLVAGAWADVTARFDDEMRNGLSDDALAAAWAEVVAQVGTLLRHDAPEAARAADLTITNTLLRFEAGEFVARITFRDDQRIAGLYILTPDAAA